MEWTIHLLLTLLVDTACANVLPYSTVPKSRKSIRILAVRDAPTEGRPADFSKEFATALGVAAAAVITATTLICIVAHCWRQILDGIKHRRVRMGPNRARKDEEAWFYRAEDCGLPLPQIASPVMNPTPRTLKKKRENHENLSDRSGSSGGFHVPLYRPDTSENVNVSTVHARKTRAQLGLRSFGFKSKSPPTTTTRAVADGNDAATVVSIPTLPSWQDSEERGQLQSVAYYLEHRSSFDSLSA